MPQVSTPRRSGIRHYFLSLNAVKTFASYRDIGFIFFFGACQRRRVRLPGRRTTCAGCGSPYRGFALSWDLSAGLLD
jgi:hypothetical protein